MTLTCDVIMNMPADGMMDACIWVDVFGGGTVTGKLPPFSTNIKAAWDVVERMKQNGFNAVLMNAYSHSPQRPFENGCSFENKKHIGGYIIGYGETMPLAICRAALLAVQSASPTHDLP